jgi:hypothetical protein
MAIAFTGCKRPADTEMEAFAKTVEGTVDPTELQVWANSIICNTPKGRLFKEISTNGLPRGVQSLLTNFATLEISMDSFSNKVVCYTAGGGFGHRGFAVSDTNYVCNFGHTQIHWTNGIWFWTE